MSVVTIRVDLDDRGAIINTQALGNEIKKLPGVAAPASDAFARNTREMRQASEAAQLFGYQLGIQLPRAVSRFIGESKALGSVLTTAFNFSIYLAAGYALVTWVTDIIGKLSSWGQESAEVKKKNDELTKSIQEQVKALDDYYDRLDKAKRARAAIGLDPQGRAGAEVAAARAAFDKAKIEYSDLMAQFNRLAFRMGDTDRFGKPTPEALKAISSVEEVRSKMLEAEQNYMLAKEELATRQKELEHGITEETKKEYDARKKNLDEWERQNEEAYLKQLENAKVAGAAAAKASAETNEAAQRAFYHAVGADIITEPTGWVTAANVAGGERINMERARNILKVWEENQSKIKRLNEEMARDAEQKFQRASDAIEGFFNRVFLTARSFSDVWHQLWGQITNYAVSQIAKMVAAWWLGHKSMAQASATGGGSLGGAGGGMGQGIASVMSMATAAPAMAGGGIPFTAEAMAGGGNVGALGGSWGGGILGGTGAGGIGAGASLGSRITSFLGSPAGLGLAGMGGLALMNYGAGRGNMALAGIGGFLGGGLAGMAIGGSSMFAGTALGAFAGPIGAGIGLVAGLLIAMFSRGKQKRQSAAVHEQYLEAQKQVLEAYLGHKADYDSSVTALTSAYGQAVSALTGMGGPGRNTISEITQPYKDTLERMKNIQLAREGRLAFTGGMPAPEYQTGSMGRLSGPSSGFPVTVHPGEAILNPRAAAQLGDANIRAMNRGGSGGQQIIVHQHFPNVVDNTGFERTLIIHKDALTNVVRRLSRDQAMKPPF